MKDSDAKSKARNKKILRKPKGKQDNVGEK